jgi:Family of unknown function (DUF5946)
MSTANSAAAHHDECPSCRAPLGGRAGCQLAFDALSAQAWTSPARGAVHNLVVDTYGMQHPEEYCRSGKSYAAHLTGLCHAMEGETNPEQYWAIPRWLDGRVTVQRPADIAFRGHVTIAAVCNLSELEYQAGARWWAADVWAAYSAHHTLAREWLRAAMAHSMRRTPMVRP